MIHLIEVMIQNTTRSLHRVHSMNQVGLSPKHAFLFMLELLFFISSQLGNNKGSVICRNDSNKHKRTNASQRLTGIGLVFASACEKKMYTHFDPH